MRQHRQGALPGSRRSTLWRTWGMRTPSLQRLPVPLAPPPTDGEEPAPRLRRVRHPRRADEPAGRGGRQAVPPSPALPSRRYPGDDRLPRRRAGPGARPWMWGRSDGHHPAERRVGCRRHGPGSSQHRDRLVGRSARCPGGNHRRPARRRGAVRRRDHESRHRTSRRPPLDPYRDPVPAPSGWTPGRPYTERLEPEPRAVRILWRGLEVPRHLQILTGPGLRRLLEECGPATLSIRTSARGANGVARESTTPGDARVWRLAATRLANCGRHGSISACGVIHGSAELVAVARV